MHDVQKSLREKRKTETTLLIREAAVALARERGVANVTVEAICETVGVSTRTFFNYFSFKEAVFVLPPPPLPEPAVARFLASSGDMMMDLVDLMVAQAEDLKGSFDAALLIEVAEAHPRVMPLQMAEFQKFDAQLRELIARRIGLGSDDMRCQVLASAFIGATRPMMDRWRKMAEPSLPRLVRQSLTEFVDVVRATPAAEMPPVRRARK